MKNLVPYPLSAARIDLSIAPFSILSWLPKVKRFNLTEEARKQGEMIWYARWLIFQVSYSRWV